MASAMWRNFPVVKHKIINQLLLRTHAVLSQIQKTYYEQKDSKDLHKTILPLLVELAFPLKDEIYVMRHERGKGDVWSDLLRSTNVKMKNTNKLEIFLDHDPALKITNMSKYFGSPLPVDAQGGIAFKLNHSHDYLFLYKKADEFIKSFFEIIFNTFSALAWFFAAGQENSSLREQIELLKKQVIEVNDRLTDAEKNLKRRLHEIDQLFQVSNELFGMVDRENLINTALLIIVGQLGADSTFALLLNEEDETYSDFYSKGFGIEQQDFSLDKNHPLVIYFRDGGDILFYEEIQYKSDMVNILPFFNETKAQMVAPLIIDGQLIGILGCGEKLFGGAYDSIDKRIFRVLMNTITLAFKNQFLYQKVSEESFIDENTGLPNVKYFEKRMDEEKSRAKRQKSSLGLFIIHPLEGDVLAKQLEKNDVLAIERKAAKKLQPIIRKQDFLSIVEPVTFALVSPGIKEEAMFSVIERIKKALEPFAVDEKIHPDRELHFEVEKYIYPEKEIDFELTLGRFLKKEDEEETGGEDLLTDLDFNF